MNNNLFEFNIFSNEEERKNFIDNTILIISGLKQLELYYYNLNYTERSKIYKNIQERAKNILNCFDLIFISNVNQYTFFKEIIEKLKNTILRNLNNDIDFFKNCFDDVIKDYHNSHKNKSYVATKEIGLEIEFSFLNYKKTREYEFNNFNKKILDIVKNNLYFDNEEGEILNEYQDSFSKSQGTLCNYGNLILELILKNNNNFKVETDSSIRNSYINTEFILKSPLSIEKTIKATKQLYNFINELNPFCRGKGKNNNCGIHCHINKNIFENISLEQFKNNLKLFIQRLGIDNINIINNRFDGSYYSFNLLSFEDLASQLNSTFSNSENFFSMEQDKKKLNNIESGNRYVLFNFTQNTIEYRGFRSSENYSDLEIYLLFIQDFIKFILNGTTTDNQAPYNFLNEKVKNYIQEKINLLD